jgi:hypothetical protein
VTAPAGRSSLAPFLFPTEAGVAFRLAREFSQLPYAIVADTVHQARVMTSHNSPDLDAYRIAVEIEARRRLTDQPNVSYAWLAVDSVVPVRTSHPKTVI